MNIAVTGRHWRQTVWIMLMLAAGLGWGDLAGWGKDVAAQSGGSWTHTSLAELGAACSTRTGVRVTDMAGGEVRLTAGTEDYFTTPPVDEAIWWPMLYNGVSQGPFVSNGELTINSNAVVTWRTDMQTRQSVEARLNWAPDGLTGVADWGLSDPYNVATAPMALFITDHLNNLYANDWQAGTPISALQRTLISGVDVTQYHHFRIEVWPERVEYYVDGVLRVSHAQPGPLVSSPMAYWVLSTGVQRRFLADWVRCNLFGGCG